MGIAPEYLNITENLRRVRDAISEKCSKIGRNPAEIGLVAVSKTVAVERLREATRAGIVDFGENYAQELVSKRNELDAENLRWHFIGHLQSNKAKYIAGFVHLIHSVDSASLAAELSRQSLKVNRTLDVLIEVHTTDEATKFGCSPKETLKLAESISKLPGLHLKGLMTMGPFSENDEDSRDSFRIASRLREDICREGFPSVSMEHLSIGMTHDYQIAIEEGATLLRIGTAIFGKRT